MKYVASTYAMLLGGCLFLLGMYSLLTGKVIEGLLAVFGGVTLAGLGIKFPRR